MVQTLTLKIDSKEAIKDQIRLNFFIVYLLLIFEGALRKWILPQLSSPLFFVKEPFILYIYYLAFKHRLLPHTALFNLIIFFCFLFFLLMNVQSLIFNFSLTIGLYGWRNYCLYAPMSFIIAYILIEKDIIRIAYWSCIIGIGMAVLGFIQYSSPVDSFINKGVGTGLTEIFTVVSGVVRPYGTFSFTSGFSLFVTSFFVFLIYNFFLGKKAFLNKPLFYICTFSFVTCLAVSGSRSTYLSVGIILFCVSLSSIFLIKRRQGFLILIYLLSGVILAILLFSFVFTDQLAIIQQRQEIAQDYEGSIFTRIFSLMLGSDFFVNTDLSLLGVGIGLASGGGAYIASGVASFSIAETEWARHLLEAGLLMGIIYILFRIGIVVDIFKDAVSALLKTSNPSPLAFVGFVFPNVLVGAITGNGVSYAYTWIFLGISLAVNRIYKNPISLKNNQ